MDQNYQELKEWLEATKDQPLETMAGFFDARTDDYEEHMIHWKRHYQWMAELLPASVKNLLDIGCGSGHSDRDRDRPLEPPADGAYLQADGGDAGGGGKRKLFGNGF